MISFPELLTGFCGWLARASAQACVLIVLVLAAQALLRGKLAPRWRYALWLLVMVRLMLPWAPESPVSVYNLPLFLRHFVVMTASPAHDMGTTEFPMPALVQGEELRAGPSEAPPPVIAQSVQRERRSLPSLVPVSLGVLLPLVWLAGAVVLAGFVLGQSMFLARTVRQRRSLTNQRALDILEDCKELMGISAYLAVVETCRVRSPALFGFVRPRLLLPAGALDALGPDRLRHVFLHELAHLRRHDVAINWLMTLLQVLHWFNPLVWYAFGRMRADREMACDALALSHARPGESLEYGRTIVHLLENFSQTRRLPSLAGILENQSQMKRRIAMIARFTKDPKRWPLPALALMVLLGAAALTNAQQDSMTPAEAQEFASSAKGFVELVARQDFAKAEPLFDTAMKKALPEAKLKETWNALLKESGPLGKVTGYRVERFLSKRIVLVRCEFQNGPLDAKIVYNSEKKITGLWFVPTAVGSAYLSFADLDTNQSLEDLQTHTYAIRKEIGPETKALVEAILRADKASSDSKSSVTLVEETKLIVRASAKDLANIEALIGRQEPEDPKLIQDRDIVTVATFNLTLGESLRKDPTVAQDFGKSVVEAVETMLYGKEGKARAYKQGRRLWYDPATFQLTLTDYPDRIKLVSDYLASLPQLEQSGTAALAIEKLRILPYKEGGLYSLIVSIRNKGSLSRPGVKVLFYRGAPDKGGEIIRDAKNWAGPINPGALFNEMSLPFALKDGVNEFTVAVGEEDKTAETVGTVKRQTLRVTVKEGKVVEQQEGNSTPGRTAAESSHIPATSAINAEGRIVDKTDYPFVNDPAVIGSWKSVDFLAEPGQFKPGQKQFPGDPPAKEFVILPDGKTSKPWETWTKGMIFHSGDRTAGRYDLKELDGSTYMFFERKDSRYLILHAKPNYCVLRKESSGTGGLAEAWAALPSDEEFRRSFSEKIARLDIDTANLDRVIEVLGKPAQFMRGNESYTRDTLPSHYLMIYPDRFSIHMAGNKIVELRYNKPGYFFRGKLQVGSTLEDVLKVVGEPKETVEGKKVKGHESEFKAGILYKDLDGKKGDCYYPRPDQKVRFFFEDNKVRELYVVSSLYVTLSEGKGESPSR